MNDAVQVLIYSIPQLKEDSLMPSNSSIKIIIKTKKRKLIFELKEQNIRKTLAIYTKPQHTRIKSDISLITKCIIYLVLFAAAAIVETHKDS